MLDAEDVYYHCRQEGGRDGGREEAMEGEREGGRGNTERGVKMLK